MRKIFVIALTFFATITFGQRLKDFKQQESWYDFKTLKSEKTLLLTFANNFKEELEIRTNESLVIKRQEKDNSGRTHIFYRHYLNNIEVEYSELILHSSHDNVYTEIANDKISKNLIAQNPNISEAEALRQALAIFRSTRYAWQDSLEEAEVKEETKDKFATHYPKGQLIYAKAKNEPQLKDNYRLSYKFTIYSIVPFYKKAVYIDAITGKVFKDIDLLINCNDPATATTLYNGNQQIITDWKGWPWNRYILIDCNNRNIHTKYGTGINHPEAESSSTTWGTNHQAATSCHWAAEVTWDLYRLVYGRNGTNNSNREVKALVDFELNGEPLIDNAYYDLSGGNNDKIRIGRTSVGDRSLSTLDIIGHEITHGLTKATADLVYEGQAGALNEGFSDIFGFMVERRGQAGVFDWRIGEDAFQETVGIRDLLNPNLFGDPAFVGQPGFWTGDNADVHTNSGIPNRWFSILSNGGFQNGVNVAGIGIDNAALIAWNTLVFNLGQNSNFNDARNASINVARWIFGECSNEVIQVTNAWAAVGVGNVWQIQTINLIPVYGFDCNSVTVAANIPVTSIVTWTTTNGLLINGNASPFTSQGNTVNISSPNGLDGSISATLTGCQTNAITFCPCISWDNPSITWIWSSPMTGEPLQAEVTPAHPNALYYEWYINGQLVETTYGTFLSTYNWPCTSEGDGLSVIAVTSCGVSSPVNGGTYSPICYGRSASSNVKLFPNPASSQVTIQLEELKATDKNMSSSLQRTTLNDIVQIKFMDKVGSVRKIMRYAKGIKTVSINISDLPSDVYYLEITDGKIITTKALIIRR